MIKDAWRTKSWKEKFTLWFKPTGYRPADVLQNYPVYKIEDVYEFEKYDPRASASLKIWAWVQLIILLLFVSYLFGNIALINSLDPGYIFWYGGFIFLSVYALTDLLDRNTSAIFFEFLRSGLGIGFLYQQQDWFGASTYLSSIQYVLMSYFVLSIIITSVFVLQHRREDHSAMVLSSKF